jgi:hypothetical protein
VVPPLILEERRSIFERMTCYEIVDCKLLDRVIEQNEGHPQCEWLLKRYRDLVIEGRVPVQYTKPEFGRAIVSGSLGMHNMEKEVRYILAHRQFTDWDMKNAHPTILEQVCRAHRIACPALNHYVNKREECLEKVSQYYNVERNIAKDLYLRMMFLGGFTSWASEYDIRLPIMKDLKEFSLELSGIARLIIEKNESLVKFINTKKPKKNLYFEATVLSTFLQEIESRLLETIVEYCLEKRIICDGVCVLCNDGLMLESQYSHRGLSSLFTSLLRERHGFEIEFVEKSMII